MNKQLVNQLESMIRTHAPIPPLGKEEVIDRLLSEARKQGSLIEMALITLLNNGIPAKVSIRTLLNLGVPTEDVYSALSTALISVASAAQKIKGEYWHGPN